MCANAQKFPTMLSRFLSPIKTVSFALLFLLVSSLSLGQTPQNEAKKAPTQLELDAEAIKKELIDLNRELYRFEESLLHPNNTQLVVFLSLAEGTRFQLDSLELQLDGQLISSHLYQDQEITAILGGCIQRLYIVRITTGKHKLSGKFNGKGRANYYKRDKSLFFTKDKGAKYLQIVISDSPADGAPLFKVKQW
jgi:hypothetical protein